MTDENQTQETEVEETAQAMETTEETGVVEGVAESATDESAETDAPESDEQTENDIDETVEVEQQNEDDESLDDGAPTPTHAIINTDEKDLVGGILALSHGSLTKAFIEEIQNAPMAWQKMGESAQREVIERCKKRAATHITKIANAILNRGFEHCEAFVDTVTHKDGCKAVLKTVDTEGGLELARRQGENVLVVFTDEAEYIEGADNFPKASPDQGDFLTDNGLDMVTDKEADEIAVDEVEVDPLYEQAVDFVIAENSPTADAIQKELRVGYNRAVLLLEAMEQNGIVSVVDESGNRTVVGLEGGEQLDVETGEIIEQESMASDEQTESNEKPGNYDLIVTGSVETSVNAKSLEDAVHLLGYTEFDIVNKGEPDEFATIFDDERIEDNDATVEVHFSNDQTAPAE